MSLTHRLHHWLSRPLSRLAWGLAGLLALAMATGTARAADDFLDPAVAFTVTAQALPDKKLQLTYKIAPGYYLYRERFKFDSPDAKLGAAAIPAGAKHYDTALEQNVETYHDQVVVTLPIASAGKSFTIDATHQGCAEKGLCYPPQPRVVKVSMKAFGADADSAQVVAADAVGGDGAAPAATAITATTLGTTPAVADTGVSKAVDGGANGSSVRNSVLGLATGSAATAQAATASAVDANSTTPNATAPATVDSSRAAGATPPPASDDNRLAAALHGGRLWVVLSIAFGFGLLLSMTPCVWPMLPILSSIIVGQGQSVTPRRGLALAAVYSLGMALVYTALGIAAGLAGEGLAAFLQSPAVLLSFGLLLAILSLSMFGVYELQLPERWRDKLNATNQSLSGGQLGGVFGMGVLSALIVSPCVSAPLAGALLYISQTRDAVLGGAALFAIAAGMSVPLLVVGTSAGSLLPRSGAWMDRVKQVFGLLLLGVAIYIVQPVLPGLVAMILWGTLLVLGAASLGAFEPIAAAAAHPGGARLLKGFGLLLALLGALQFIGIASGGRDPSQPLSAFASSAHAAGGAGTATAEGAPVGEPAFQRVASVDELDQQLRSAHRPVMLDFYADWCVSCKEMEKETFVSPAVKAKLVHAVLLRADVTANSPADRALLKRFELFGPPGIIFFDPQGREVQGGRVVGFQDTERFSTSLADAGL